MIAVTADWNQFYVWANRGAFVFKTMGSNSPALRPHFNGALAALQTARHWNYHHQCLPVLKRDRLSHLSTTNLFEKLATMEVAALMPFSPCWATFSLSQRDIPHSLLPGARRRESIILNHLRIKGFFEGVELQLQLTWWLINVVSRNHAMKRKLR